MQTAIATFHQIHHGIESTTTTFVAPDDPVRYWLVKLANLSNKPRRLSLFACVTWVLGEQYAKSFRTVVTTRWPGAQGVIARNPCLADFGDAVGFLIQTEPTFWITGNLREFVGQGSLRNPAALRQKRLSGTVGSGFLPCGAVQIELTLLPGASFEGAFVLGAGRDEAEAKQLIARHQSLRNAHQVLAQVRAMWTEILGCVQLECPEPALSYLTNHWLLYQTVASRLWGRTGYYQSSGAYGFRDQLQDSLALLWTRPAWARAQIVRCAGRQFCEGDVQHWWHPPSGRGVRTRFADDYLWLVYAVATYVEVTDDRDLLEEEVGFLNAPLLADGEEDRYLEPGHGTERGTVYEHCRRALLRSTRRGAHGLPLFGAGDWNDGMNRVGMRGKGESVWLAMFLVDIMKRFVPFARARRDDEIVTLCERETYALKEQIGCEAWDGAWYRRGFYDSGASLGSKGNSECQIDLLVQAFAVLADIRRNDEDDRRLRQAMASALERLVRRGPNLIQLLDPPFGIGPSDEDPGYIRAYIPGVRENGGQYTHAAVWAIMALVRLGERDLAWELVRMILPINRADSKDKVACYQVEPYAVAADVYFASGHEGRGGWTWYTGSAAWLYRLITEELLGLRRCGNRMWFAPCLPSEWPKATVNLVWGSSKYEITLWAGKTGRLVNRVMLDERELTEPQVELVDDGALHKVSVHLL